jgi:hypothetical protein
MVTATGGDAPHFAERVSSLLTPGAPAHHRHMRVMAAALLVALVGCGGDSGPCQPRTGLYLVSYKTRSGNCGTINDVVVNADTIGGSQGMVACAGTALANDECDGDIDVACPFEGQTLISRGTVHWHHDASAATASIYVELRSQAGTIVCNGIYDVAYSRP